MFETLNPTYAFMLAAGGLGLAVLLALKLYSYDPPSGTAPEAALPTVDAQEAA
jgi:hypothetical protein